VEDVTVKHIAIGQPKSSQADHKPLLPSFTFIIDAFFFARLSQFHFDIKSCVSSSRQDMINRAGYGRREKKHR
jgi:hypothetical protein